MTTYSVETASGIVTSWLPLTTDFSAPSACFTGIYSQQAKQGIEAGPGQLIAFDPFFFSSVDLSFTACFPRQATQWWDQSSGQGLSTDPLSTVTSLGPFECPGGYTTAFTTEESPASTQIACCPSGYDYQGWFYEPGNVGECWSTPKSGSTMQYFTPLVDSWSETSTVLGSTHIAGVQINGWNFAALTQPSATTSSTTAATNSPTATDSPTASASSLATSVSSANTSAKSSSPVGAVAGGVAGGVSMIILIVAAYFFGRKGRFGQGSRYRIQEHYPDSPSTQHLAHQPSNDIEQVPLGNLTGRTRPTGHQNNMAPSAAAAPITASRYDKKGVLITEPLEGSASGSVVPKKTSASATGKKASGSGTHKKASGSGVKKSSKPKTSSSPK